MNNIEKNAIRIAELLGQQITGDYIIARNPEPNPDNTVPYAKIQTKKYSSYNGLMPIVWECNQDFGYNIRLNGYNVVLDEYRNTFPYSCGDTQTEFIEAIQKAVIKYLELKG